LALPEYKKKFLQLYEQIAGMGEVRSAM